jgi:5'-deoxynucleotidase YfbR-like HD superfamily hydrolase
MTHALTEEKHLRERLGFKYLSCLAKPASPKFADEITMLWSEFEEGTSRASVFVRSIDAIECMDQAVIYKKRLRHATRLEEFAELESRVTAPELKDWVGHLKHEQEAVWARASFETPILFVLGMILRGQP